ncbi:ABC transporter permease [Blastopirellula marina]|uniref:Transport permease protein n=1 Tax=Blastopirellula marina TaxID=124 RepID=A0A2S8F6G9_9BACT|nr:ABC transporter permease [Blastopirellula marina]PQO27751.1 multidrug ABC transporter permease [Blastopirellula marina]PTL41491.1 multidrug ABC transporter permease [Blastopirellula marina]
MTSETLPTPNPLTAAWSLCYREIIRFLRQRNRIIGAIGQPIIFWLLFGTGLTGVFRTQGEGGSDESFTVYFFPGTLLLIVLFTAIFATISIIEDRNEGFLQSVLVSPIPRWSMVLGKVLGGTILAVGQAMLFLCLGYFVGISLSIVQFLAIFGILVIASIGLTSLGFWLAWRMDSTQGFHAVMNLLLMPMWLLSGAFFPIPTGSAITSPGQWVLSWVMTLNPVTYALGAIRRILHAEIAPSFLGGESGGQFWLPSVSFGVTITLLFAVVMFALSCRAATKTRRGDWL